MTEPDDQAEDEEEESKTPSQNPTLKPPPTSSEANLQNSGAEHETSFKQFVYPPTEIVERTRGLET